MTGGGSAHRSVWTLQGFLSVFRLLPESGRWLLSKGRQDEAKEVLEFTAKRNGWLTT